MDSVEREIDQKKNPFEKLKINAVASCNVLIVLWKEYNNQRIVIKRNRFVKGKVPFFTKQHARYT